MTYPIGRDLRFFFRRAMALKALDQRLANPSSSLGSPATNAAPSQSRLSPPTLGRTESAPTAQSQPLNGRSHERAKSVSESDEAGKPKSEKR